MKAYLVDGTYELFRHYFGAPPHQTRTGEQVGATRAVLGSLLGMLEDGATHMAVATDHVIESWRNEAWPTYKSSAGVAEDLLSQFPLFEEALAAMGLVVWPMTELEADDALASGAAVLAEDERLSQVLICTPDKDLGQCVQGQRVVCLDRRKGAIVDEEAVRARFGVAPRVRAGLVGPGRGQRGWLPGVERLGGQNDEHRAGPLRLDRGYPDLRGSLGHRGPVDGPHRVFGRHAEGRPRPGVAVQKAGHLRRRPRHPGGGDRSA